MRATYEVLETVAACTPLDAFARAVRDGFSHNPKSIPSMYFYDDVGSSLFQRITESDDYYLTRCEEEILRKHGPRIAQAVSARPFRLVELGVGDARKTEILLRQFLEAGLRFDYVPIDICRQTIVDLAERLPHRVNHAALCMHGLVAEYFDALALLQQKEAACNVVLFLGSNIGNFTPQESRRFLRGLWQSLNPGDYVLVGFDLKKDIDVLQRAYNDREGVTREFNLNLLDRINRELGGRFVRRYFTHHGTYDAARQCMESWLVSREDQQVPIRAIHRIVAFRAWEAVHVESSYKYDVDQIEAIAADCAFSVRCHFFDSRRYFVDSLWQV